MYLINPISVADIGSSCQLHMLLYVDWIYWPIRLFLESLMYNNIYHLTEESHPVCIHVTKRVSVELIPISWCQKLKTGVLTTNPHINSSRIDMLFKCSCKVGSTYELRQQQQWQKWVLLALKYCSSINFGIIWINKCNFCSFYENSTARMFQFLFLRGTLPESWLV